MHIVRYIVLAQPLCVFMCVSTITCLCSNRKYAKLNIVYIVKVMYARNLGGIRFRETNVIYSGVEHLCDC